MTVIPHCSGPYVTKPQRGDWKRLKAGEANETVASHWSHMTCMACARPSPLDRVYDDASHRLESVGGASGTWRALCSVTAPALLHRHCHHSYGTNEKRKLRG